MVNEVYLPNSKTAQSTRLVVNTFSFLLWTEKEIHWWLEDNYDLCIYILGNVMFYGEAVHQLWWVCVGSGFGWPCRLATRTTTTMTICLQMFGDAGSTNFKVEGGYCTFFAEIICLYHTTTHDTMQYFTTTHINGDSFNFNIIRCVLYNVCIFLHIINFYFTVSTNKHIS